MLKKVRDFLRWCKISYEEADSVDPWRNTPWGREQAPTGIRLLDLAIIHLQDHGYRVRSYRNNNMIVVFNGWWQYFTHNRVGTIAFEYGRSSIFSRSGPNTHIWHYGFGKKWALHAGTDSHPSDSPRVLCETSDPFCLDRILEKTNEYYSRT